MDQQRVSIRLVAAIALIWTTKTDAARVGFVEKE